MSLLDSTLSLIAFKNLQGKSMTDINKGVGNEAEGIKLNIDATTIFIDSIDSNPATSVIMGVAEFVIADLTLDNTSNNQAYFATYPIGHPLVGQRVKNAISPTYGIGYEAKPYIGASPIPINDPIDWIYQYQSGVFYLQDPVSLTGTPTTIELYVYTGLFLSDSINPNLQVDWIVNTNNDLEMAVSGNVLPYANGINDLGNSLLRWNDIYINSTINANIIVTPANPDPGFWKLYPKTDGFYELDEFGNETKLGVGPIITSNNTFYVSADYGDDGTAVAGSLNNMYQTIDAACVAANAIFGGTVHVFPGQYNNFTNLLYNNVNIHFEKGAIVNCFTTTPFNDIAGSINASITGHGEFNCYVFFAGNFIALQDGNNSVINFECDKILAYTGATLQVFNGKLNLRCKELYEYQQYLAVIGQLDNAPGRTNGVVNIDIDYVYGGSIGGGFVYTYGCVDGIERIHKINIKLFETNVTSNWGAVVLYVSSEKCVIYFNGEIRNINPSGSFLGACFNMIVGAGTIIAKGRFTTLTDYVALIYGNGGTPYADKATITIRDSYCYSGSTGSPNAVATIKSNNPNGFIKLINSYIIGNAQSVVSVGVADIGGSDNAGSVEIHNCRIQSKDTVTGYLVYIEGGNLTISNSILYSELATNPSIFSSTPQTIKLFTQSFTNVDIDANITPTIGTLVVDTGVTLIGNENE